MRKIILFTIAVLLLAACSHSVLAQSTGGIAWDRYTISGQLATYTGNKAITPDPCAAFQVGKDTTNKGLLLPRVIDTVVASVKKGLMIYRLLDNNLYVYNGLSWDKVGSSGPTFDTTYIYAYIDSIAASITAGVVDSGIFATRYWTDSLFGTIPSGEYDTTYLYSRLDSFQYYVDTNGYDATKAWVLAQGYSTGTAAYDTTYLYGVLDSLQRDVDSNSWDASKYYVQQQIALIPAPYDTSYLYTVLDSFQYYLDTNTYDATRHWVGQQGFLTGFSETDPLSPHKVDSNTNNPNGYTTKYYVDTLVGNLPLGGSTYVEGGIDIDVTGTGTFVDPFVIDFIGAPPYDTAYLYTVIDSFQHYTDTSTYDATRAWVQQQNYLISEVDGSITNELQTWNQTVALDSVTTHQIRVNNATSAIAGVFQGSNTSYAVALLTTSAGGGIQAYNSAVSSARNFHMQSAGGNLRIGTGTPNEYKFQINGKVWINEDSIALGSTGTDNILVHSPGTDELKYISIADLVGAIPTYDTTYLYTVLDSMVRYDDSLVTFVTPKQLSDSLAGVGGAQDLQDVTDNGNTTTNAIESSSYVQGSEVRINGANVARVKADNLTGIRIVQMPDANITAAGIAQIITNGNTHTCPSEDAVFDALALKQNALGYTAEDAANKSTSTSLGASNTLYPTQLAVKTYVDAAVHHNVYEIAFSDATTAITTGTAKETFRLPYGCVIDSVRASVTTAGTGSALTIDINEAGTTILSTKLTIDASEKTSVTAATPYVISDANIAFDAEMTIDVDVAPTGAIAGKLKIFYHW